MPKHALMYAVTLAVLLNSISGRRRYHRNRFKSDQHEYPPSGGLSGRRSSGGHPPAVGSHGFVSYDTRFKNNYRYSPPQTLTYSPVRGRAPVQYPVYHGTPPNYLYKYKSSGSKYGTLLTGLALLNLGALGVTAYSQLKQSSRRTPQPGEVCKFEVKKDNGDYEETKIDCDIISSFILKDQMQSQATGANTATTGIVDHPMLRTPPAPEPFEVLYKIQPNGTLVPVNVTGVSGGAMPQNGELTSSVVTTTTKNTSLVNALDVKGKDVEVTPGMQCFVTRTSPVHNMRKNVPCGLLQMYADKSLKIVKSAAPNGPMLTIMTVIVASCVAY